MGLKKIRGYIILLFISVFLCVLCRSEIAEISKVSRLRPEGIESEGFRKQTVNDNVYDLIRTSDSPGEYLAVYWLESRFGREDVDITPEDAARLKESGEISRDGRSIWMHALQYGMTCCFSCNGP